MTMRPLTRLLVPAAAAVLLAGCFGSDPTATPTASVSTLPSAGTESPAIPSQGAESFAPVPTSEPIPSDELEAFTCELPIVEPGSAAVANIVDVRVGTHDGYDRVVFEFEQGTPELTLDRAEPPFTQDASGLPIEVDGESFLGLSMRGGTKQTDEGTSSYDGPTDISPGFAMLMDLVEGGDFERQSTWYLGLSDEACVRVLLLDAPPRLVIDVEH
jgi:hypothetical protein